MAHFRVPEFVSARETLYTQLAFRCDDNSWNRAGKICPQQTIKRLEHERNLLLHDRAKHIDAARLRFDMPARVQQQVRAAAAAPSRMASRLDFTVLLLFGHGTRPQVLGELRELLAVLIEVSRRLAPSELPLRAARMP